MNETDDRNDLMMVVNHVNRNCVLLDLMKDGNLDASRDLRKNDRLDGHLKDDDRHDALVGHRKNVMDDLSDLNSDVNRGRRMNDLLADHLMDDDRHVVLVGHRMNVKDDQNLGANRVNRNYALRDRKMDVNLGAMSLRVMLMVYLNMSCDRKSHDHLRCDHLMMRHRDTNRMDVKNLDVSWR